MIDWLTIRRLMGYPISRRTHIDIINEIRIHVWTPFRNQAPCESAHAFWGYHPRALNPTQREGLTSTESLRCYTPVICKDLGNSSETSIYQAYKQPSSCCWFLQWHCDAWTMPGEDVPGDSGLFGGSNIDPSCCSIMFHWDWPKCGFGNDLA